MFFIKLVLYLWGNLGELKMILTVIISAITILAMAVCVLVKPYLTIKNRSVGLYWIICLLGAILLLATGRISFSAVIDGVTADTSVNPLKILVLFLSMTLLSVYLGDAGFFDWVADGLFRKTNGKQLPLFLGLYAVVSILTVFTSNDVIILTFTPAICIFAKKARISPIPYLVAEFIAANTWSMALIVGNPTNVYLAQSAGIGFSEYLSVMMLPAVIGGLTGLGVLILLFGKQLHAPQKQESKPLCEKTSATGGVIKVEKTTMIVAIVHLLACIIMLALAEYIGAEMWIICFFAALSLTIFDVVYDIIHYHTVKPVVGSMKKEPYELIPFVLSMFVIVLALKSSGFTDVLKNLLITGNNSDCVSIGFVSALASNLLNNIPMSVLFESIVSGGNKLAVYGAVVGSNIGAFITPVGALAGIMWNKILSSHGVKLSFAKFVLYGVTVALPTLATTLLALFFMA